MKKTLDIYTDCSGNRTLLALGIIILDGEKERSLIHRTSLGVIKEHYNLILPKGYGGVSVGETYAIYLALKEIEKLGCDARIYTDCESSYQLVNDAFIKGDVVEKRINKPKNVLMKYMVNKCRKQIKRLKYKFGIKIDLRWVPGHVDIYGNELADQAAKQCYQNNGLGRFFIE